MTHAKEAMIRQEDNRVGRTVIGMLMTPLGLLLGMGLLISF